MNYETLSRDRRGVSPLGMEIAQRETNGGTAMGGVFLRASVTDSFNGVKCTKCSNDVFKSGDSEYVGETQYATPTGGILSRS